jgi:hypothetical protein
MFQGYHRELRNDQPRRCWDKTAQIAGRYILVSLGDAIHPNF